MFGSDRRGTTDAEEERGLDLPIHVFPLFENALRAERVDPGRAPPAHRAAVVASSRRWPPPIPTPGSATRRTAEEIITASAANRMIAYPYTKLLTANMQVDQGAALIMCSAGAARAAGVPQDRWIFPLAGADADDHWFLSHRPRFPLVAGHPPRRGLALSLAGSTIDEIGHLDLYSCFPSVVEIAAAELGVPDDDPARPLTLTGGLTFGGGPGNNYGTHSVASMVAALRADPGSRGLVTGLGWYVTKHSVGVYGTEPAPRSQAASAGPGLPAGTQVETAGGFAWADPQAAVGALPQCSPDTDAQGEVTVETYSVSFDRMGSPERAVVACRTPEGRRAWANVTTPDHLDLLVTEEGCGRLGKLRPDGEVDLR